MEPIKAYRPRHGLQLYRFEEQIIFQCDRCGEAKKTRLQARYAGSPEHRLCNGCYGFLLSVLDIRERHAHQDEKASLLATLLLQGFAKSQKQDAERRLRVSESRTAYLDQRSIVFISTSDLIQTALASHCDLDWSPGIIGYCKAVENEILERLVGPLQVVLAGRVPNDELNDKDIGRMARFCNSPNSRPPELGTFAHFLKTFIHNTAKHSTSDVMKACAQHIAAFPGNDWIVDPNGLYHGLVTLSQQYRNRAAHLGTLADTDYIACRDFVIGPDGLLWRLVEATLDQKSFNKASRPTPHE